MFTDAKCYLQNFTSSNIDIFSWKHLFLRISYYILRYIKLQTYPNMVVMLLKHMPFPLEATSLIDVLQGSQILYGGNQTLIDALPINVVVFKCIYFWWCLRDITRSDYGYESRYQCSTKDVKISYFSFCIRHLALSWLCTKTPSRHILSYNFKPKK